MNKICGEMKNRLFIREPGMTQRPQPLFKWRLGLSGVCVPLSLVITCLVSASVLNGQQQDEATPAFTPAQIEFFESKIRPLLAQHCFECHSHQSSHAEGGLYLDSRQGLLAGGDSGPAIETSDLQASIFLDAINYGELFEMPPSSKLPQQEIDLLTQWIEMGAPWPSEQNLSKLNEKKFDIQQLKAEHWCWQPPQSVPIPEVPDPVWNRQAIDRFIYRQLAQNQLAPSPPADRRSLIRRAYFDLVGLPPSPQQVQDFVESNEPDAFERIIEQLLASPRFGERWARHWMDLVRYAETYGHEFDYPINNAFQYRDYLIRALNADLPYDQFVLEHLAGDLLPTPRLNPQHQFNESVLGTGFWFLGEAVHAPVDVRADQAGRIDNQIDVFTKTFLGLTVACARCHDHKFDAISIEDYYGLAGYLQSSRRQNVMLDMDGKISAGVQELTPALEQADQQLARLLDDYRQLPTGVFAGPLTAIWQNARRRLDSVAEGPTDWDGTEPAMATDRKPTDLEAKWQAALELPEVEKVSHPLYPVRELARLLASEPELEFPEAVANLQQKLTAARQDSDRYRQTAKLFADFGVGGDFGWFAEGFAFSQTDRPTLAVSEPQLLQPPHLAYSGKLGAAPYGVLRSPTFIIEHPFIHYRLLARNIQIRLIIDGFEMDIFNSLLFAGMSFGVDTAGEFRWHTQSGDLGKYLGHRAYIEIIDHGSGLVALDQIWFSDQAQAPPDPPALPLPENLEDVVSFETLAGHLAEGLLTADQEMLETQVHFINWLAKNGLIPEPLRTPAETLNHQKQQLHARQQSLPAPVMGVGMADGSAVDERLFIRGNHRNLGPLVPRRMITALTPDSSRGQPEHSGSGRLDLALQIADAGNPLTSRVIVNRVWQHLLDRGIVTSVDNFGVLGEPPSHPELLDYLALDFVAGGWSIKRLIRQIMLSQTYQMSSDPTGDNEVRDPANRWYHRAEVRRLDGEAIRDSMLAISGDLDLRMYGPGVPVHLTPFMQGRGRPGQSGPLNGAGRRSIYQEVRRNFLSPFLLAFDTPIPFNTIGRRTESNVPAQALILMNSPFVQEQAARWAVQSMLQEPDLRARIELVYLQALARPASSFEIEQAQLFLRTQAAAIDLDPVLIPLSAELWADFCHVLFNVKEFIFLR
jgi:hypothetical protein